MRIFLTIIFIFNCFADFSPPHQGQKKITYSAIYPGNGDYSSVTEESFNKIIEDVYKLYRYAAKDIGIQMEIDVKNWNHPNFSAWAHRKSSGIHTINFWGGFARLPGMTDKAFALTVCHEIGHILGGAPRVNIKTSETMSSEGQSDFFASALCFKKYHKFHNLELPSSLDPYAASRCYEKLYDQEDQFEYEGCLVTAEAAMSLAVVFTSLSADEIISFDTPSLTRVDKTLYDSYPDVQCRLDTFFIGALSRYGEIDKLKSDEEGLRPACWFNEADAQHIDKAR